MYRHVCVCVGMRAVSPAHHCLLPWFLHTNALKTPALTQPANPPHVHTDTDLSHVDSPSIKAGADRQDSFGGTLGAAGCGGRTLLALEERGMMATGCPAEEV